MTMKHKFTNLIFLKFFYEGPPDMKNRGFLNYFFNGLRDIYNLYIDFLEHLYIKVDILKIFFKDIIGKYRCFSTFFIVDFLKILFKDLPAIQLVHILTIFFRSS